MKNNHIIGRQQFNIRLNTQAEAKPLFDRISGLTRERLNQGIDELLTELAPPGQTIRVDQLVVDIGELSPNNLEDEVVERVLAGLRVQLRKLLEITPETQDTSLIDQLAHFLQRGFWPWWTSREMVRTPATLLLYLLEAHPEQLRALLADLTQQQPVRQRLVNQFPRTALERVNAAFRRRGSPVLPPDVVPLRPTATAPTILDPAATKEPPTPHPLAETSSKGKDLRQGPPIRQNLRQRQASTAPATPKKNHSMEESLYLHNSGLVIVAPFLNRYFGMLDLLEERAFKDEEAAIRAVLLLEYLVSGRTEVAEHELVFNKVLCGLHLATPVPSSIELTEAEEEASRQLLNAVLQNWDKMSNSTVENLRGSFLLREGLLLEHDAYWSLKVESKGFDVLLSFLPWTISVISLPWMDKQLEVEWSTQLT